MIEERIVLDLVAQHRPVSTRELDLSDTDYFATIWRRTDIRRLLADIIKVNTSAAEFSDWFQLESEEIATAEPVKEQEVALT